MNDLEAAGEGIYYVEVGDFHMLLPTVDKRLYDKLLERLEIAEKHIALSGEVIWDSYIEEVRAY